MNICLFCGKDKDDPSVCYSCMTSEEEIDIADLIDNPDTIKFMREAYQLYLDEQNARLLDYELDFGDLVD